MDSKSSMLDKTVMNLLPIVSAIFICMTASFMVIKVNVEDNFMIWWIVQLPVEWPTAAPLTMTLSSPWLSASASSMVSKAAIYWRHLKEVARRWGSIKDNTVWHQMRTFNKLTEIQIWVKISRTEHTWQHHQPSAVMFMFALTEGTWNNNSLWSIMANQYVLR